MTNLFEQHLSSAYATLEEEAMSLPQRKAVANLKAARWEIEDRDEYGVTMSKGQKILIVTHDGSVSYLKESLEARNIDSLVELLEGDQLNEAFGGLSMGDVKDKLKGIKEKLVRLFQNLTVIVMQRGNEGYLITMKGNNAEVALISNGEVKNAHKLSSRSAADVFIKRLEDSGFTEASFESVVPRGITKLKKAAIKNAPLIALAILAYMYMPGVAWAVNGAARMIVSPVLSLVASRNITQELDNLGIDLTTLDVARDGAISSANSMLNAVR